MTSDGTEIGLRFRGSAAVTNKSLSYESMQRGRSLLMRCAPACARKPDFIFSQKASPQPKATRRKAGSARINYAYRYVRLTKN